MSHDLPRLAPRHVAQLQAHAVDPDVARRLGVHSAGRALVFPWRAPDGRIVQQLRPDDPGDGSPKYVFPAGESIPMWLPEDDRHGPVVIVEGTRQFLAAVTALEGEDHMVVGMAGCWGWSSDGMPTADFHALGLADREVYLAFDADVASNINVWTAASGVQYAAKVAGAKRVGFVALPASDRVGLDDFLAVVPAENRTDTVLGLIRNAGARLPARPHRKTAPAAGPGPAAEPSSPAGYEDEPGAAVLADVVKLLARYVVLPSEHHLVAIALWVAHTHLITTLDDSPRLSIRSAEKRSGKSRLLELVAALARRARVKTSMSTSYLFHSVELSTPTLLIDEADTIFGKNADRSYEELRGVINTGFRRGATVGRMVGEGAAMHPQDFDVFCPVALAGIGTLPDTITDRSVVITMRRRAKGEHVEKLRRRQLEIDGTHLYGRLAGWAQRVSDSVKVAEPAMPIGVEDRRADVWEPLLAIADAAGGDWPTVARRACTELNAEMMESDDSSWGVRFLGDVRLVFHEAGDPDRMRTADLVDKLRAIDDGPWDDLTPYKLSAKLKPFGVGPRQIRFDATTSAKGYLRSDLSDPWSRYLAPLLPGEPETSPTSETLGFETADRAETTRPRSSGPVSNGSAVSDSHGTGGGGSRTESDEPELFTL
jgi:hypothetical protein